MKRGAMKNISLAMLARQIGVGVATVDRVLNERGGVSPQTTRKVLQAAREAGLKRILPEEHRFPWQIEVFLSSNDSFFFPQLAQDFAAVADSLGYRRLTLHRTFVPESQPTTLARRIARSCQQRQGIIVFGNDHPAAGRLASRRSPWRGTGPAPTDSATWGSISCRLAARRG